MIHILRVKNNYLSSLCFYALILIITMHFGSCYIYKVPTEDQKVKNNYLVIEVTSDSCTLTWEKPADATPDSYRIYYKQHETIFWKYLNDISADQILNYPINYTDLDNGTYYDFGVSAVYSVNESDLHTSLDISSDPPGGWYVKWIL
jgi:hypothetical protein